MSKNAIGSLETLRPNPDWATLPQFDRKGWQSYPFGAFAESVNERVEPTNAAEEIYVGLDDLDSGNLHIRRWGKGIGLQNVISNVVAEIRELAETRLP